MASGRIHLFCAGNARRLSAYARGAALTARAFHGSPVRPKKTRIGQHLADFIEEPTAMEKKEHNRKMKEFLKIEAKLKETFEITESGDECTSYRLQRDYGKETIEVSYNTDDFVISEKDYNELSDEDWERINNAEGTPEEMERVRGAVGSRFNIIIRKPNEGRYLYIECLTTNGFTIKNVGLVPSDMTVKDMALQNYYIGPVFHDLHDDVKNGWLLYLQERDIDEYFAEYVKLCSYKKEFENFAGWMTAVKDFVDFN